MDLVDLPNDIIDGRQVEVCVSVYLSKEEMRIAKKFGLTAEQYATEKLKLGEFIWDGLDLLTELKTPTHGK